MKISNFEKKNYFHLFKAKIWYDSDFDISATTDSLQLVESLLLITFNPKICGELEHTKIY